jgi:triphosphoribosyl-dephospho-CoA synthase
LHIMAALEDTCLLHRGGRNALQAARHGALHTLMLGGSSTPQGAVALEALHHTLIGLWASPGGAADMLAATLFLDRMQEVPA